VIVKTEPGVPHEDPEGGVQVRIVHVAVVLFVRASVEVAAATPLMNVVTEAEFPLTVPE
jgi:hypothetical protein